MQRTLRLLALLFLGALVLPVSAQDLLVSSIRDNEVLRYNGQTGAFVGVFAHVDNPTGLTFGPDHHLYVASSDGSSVSRVDETTGASVDFVPSGSGGLNGAFNLAFGPDGNLYVSSQFGPFDDVLRYDGQTGAFLEVFGEASAASGLNQPTGLVFGPDGNLYVVSQQGGKVLRYDGHTGVMSRRI